MTSQSQRMVLLLVAGVMSSVLVCGPVAAQSPDVVSRARDLYESAEYEQALQLLSTIKSKPASSEAAAYQVFCLVALGRQDEAHAAVEAIVRADPLYRPAEGQVSPRIRAFFDDIRRPLLPDVARQTYARAKTEFDKKDWTPAVADFKRVIAVLDEIGATDPGAQDLRTLSTGFSDFAALKLEPAPAAPTPTPVPTPTPTPTSTPAPTPAAPAASSETGIYDEQSTGVLRPVAVSRQMPDWLPNTVEQHLVFAGSIELVVGEDGHVIRATMVKSVHPRYDGPLLQAAKGWTFQPATKDGKPVKYRYIMGVNLGK